MPQADTSLTAPTLLLAMPQVQDPFFQKSVVFLVHHDEEGSLGFIANRPTEISVTDILEGMEIEWRGGESPPAYFGGPVQPQIGTVLYRVDGAADPAPETADEDATSEVYPGLKISQHVGDLARLADQPAERFRLFLGYAGWGEGQLIDEILRNDWLVAPIQEELIFAADPQTVWEAALKSVGVDPMSLPSWTPGSGEESN